MRTKEIIRNPNFSFPLFFLFLLFYYLLFFDPSLYYHHYQPAFLFDTTYLKGFLLYPGGPARVNFDSTVNVDALSGATKIETKE